MTLKTNKHDFKNSNSDLTTKYIDFRTDNSDSLKTNTTDMAGTCSNDLRTTTIAAIHNRNT